MTRFIRATINNLKVGKIVIQVMDERGNPYGPLMLCSSHPHEIKKTGKVICSVFTKDGLMKNKTIELSKLGLVIDHRMGTSKPEEKWKH